MSNWAEYVRRFYALSPEEQEAEWNKLTPDQRVQFEAARAGSPSPPPLPSAARSRGLGRAAFLGCGALFALGVLGFVGLAIVGGLSSNRGPSTSSGRPSVESSSSTAVRARRAPH